MHGYNRKHHQISLSNQINLIQTRSTILLIIYYLIYLPLVGEIKIFNRRERTTGKQTH